MALGKDLGEDGRSGLTQDGCHASVKHFFPEIYRLYTKRLRTHTETDVFWVRASSDRRGGAGAVSPRANL